MYVRVYVCIYATPPDVPTYLVCLYNRWVSAELQVHGR